MAPALPAAAQGRSGPAVEAGTAGDRSRRLGRAILGNQPGREGTCKGNGSHTPRRLHGTRRRADASGLRLLPPRRGERPRGRWAKARVRSGRCHSDASSPQARRRRRLRAAAGAGKFSRFAGTSGSSALLLP